MEIIKEIKERFSPYAFKNKAITQQELEILFSAAGLAASAFNEQPWRFIYAFNNEEGFEDLLHDLAEPNQKWAKTASVLIITVVKKNFTYNNNENTHSWHDLGLAMGNLTIQAKAMGIDAHHMSGLNRDGAANTLNISNDYEVVTAVALGYHDGNKSFKERKPINEIAFKGKMK